MHMLCCQGGERVLFSQTHNRLRVTYNSPSRALSVYQLSPGSSRWPKHKKAVGLGDRNASMQQTILERFQTGKQLELTLERLSHSGWSQRADQFQGQERDEHKSVLFYTPSDQM